MSLVTISQHKLLYVRTRTLNHTLSLLGGGSLFASYHTTDDLLLPEDSRTGHKVKRQSKVLKTSGTQRKPDAPDGWQDRKSSVQRKAWRNETFVLPKQNDRRGCDSRLSPELRKLRVEDCPAEKEKPVRPSRSDSREENHKIVFGIAPCLLALTQGRRKAHKLFVKDGESAQRAAVLKVCEEAHRRGAQVHRVGKKSLDKMCAGRVHQGVCLQASPLGYRTKHDDATSSGKGEGAPLWLVLEKIQDPMNLGAILRSAYFLGVDRVASSLHSSCPLSPVVSKASSGAMEVIGVYGYENLEDMLRLQMRRGWQVVGTVGAEAKESRIPVTLCSDFRMTKPTLLLIGSEGEGLSKELLSLCQTLLSIPAGRELFPGIESLNVSVATGILLHSLLSSRRSTRG